MRYGCLLFRRFPFAAWSVRFHPYYVMNASRILLLTLVLTGWSTFGQAPSTNTPTLVFRDQVTPRWFAGADGETNKFWYRLNLSGDRREFIVVNATDGRRAPAFDHARVAKVLTEQTGRTLEAQKLPIDAIRFSNDGKTVRLIATNAAWICDLESYAVTTANLEDSDRTADQPQRRGRRGGGGARGG